MTFLCSVTKKSAHSLFYSEGRMYHVIGDNLTPCSQAIAIHTWLKVTCVLASFSQLLFYTFETAPTLTAHSPGSPSLYTLPDVITGHP